MVYRENQVSVWITLPVESVTVRVLDVEKPAVGYSARFCWPGLSVVTYTLRSPARTTFALNSGLNVDGPVERQAHSWIVIVLLEPLVA